MRELFLVAAGGAIGAGLRYTVGVAFVSRTGPGFPWHTFGINILGAFLLGLLMAASFASAPSGAAWRLFLAPGLLGGFTTFSTLSYESVALTQQGSWAWGSRTCSAAPRRGSRRRPLACWRGARCSVGVRLAVCAGG